MRTSYYLLVIVIITIIVVVVEAIDTNHLNPSCKLVYKCHNPNKFSIVNERNISIEDAQRGILENIAIMKRVCLWRVGLFMSGILTIILTMLAPIYNVELVSQYIILSFILSFAFMYGSLLFIKYTIRPEFYKELGRIVMSIGH